MSEESLKFFKVFVIGFIIVVIFSMFFVAAMLDEKTKHERKIELIQICKDVPKIKLCEGYQ